MIDRAGLKGKKNGNVQVSDMHANYIINLGGGTSAEVVELMSIVRDAVRTKFDVILEPEVKIFSKQGRIVGLDE